MDGNGDDRVGQPHFVVCRLCRAGRVEAWGPLEGAGARSPKARVEDALHATRAAVEEGVVHQKVMEGTGAFGYNAQTGVYEDMIAAGILDPKKVTRLALTNAASIASLMITTEAGIAEAPKDDDKKSCKCGCGSC